MKLESLKPGMIVYDVGKRRMGNTTISTVMVWQVQILDVDLESGRVRASWNGNAPRFYGAGDVKHWRLKEPVLIKSRMGYSRLATREEIRAMKAEQAIRE
jgi:hypothetical protein